MGKNYVAKVKFIGGFGCAYYFALSKENYEAIIRTHAEYVVVNNQNNHLEKHLVKIIKLYTAEDSPWKNPHAEVTGVVINFSDPLFTVKKAKKIIKN